MDAFICPVTQEIMTDPVSTPCGHTFERATLQNIDAHRGYHGRWECPTCRAPWPASFTAAAPTNFALKGAIEAALASGALQRSPSGSGIVAAGPGSVLSGGGGASAAAPVASLPIEVKVERIQDTDNVLITLTTAADAEATLPITAIVALDNSGSMGEPSADPTTQKGTDAVAFSRSDLVRHSWATVPRLLGPKNKGALVIWDNASQEALRPTVMTAAGIAAAKTCESRIKPSGGTNIWGGLLAALTVAARTPDENNVIIFQTDGEPDPTYTPGRGIIPTFRRWREDNPRVRVTVNTIGYGYGERLDTPLLREIAEVGGGVYSYVPDAGMVGSAVIHQTANLMSVHHRGVQVQIPELGTFVPVGFLQGGQPRTVVLRVPRDQTVSVCVRSDTIPEPVTVALTPETPTVTPEAAVWPLTHRMFVDELRMAFTRAETEGPRADLVAHLVADLTRLAPADPRIAALLADLYHTSKDKGQICKAFEPAAFARWGRHFIPSVLCGHANQWPFTFKDESSQLFASPITKALIDKGDRIFNSIPPPTASIAEAAYASQRAASVAMGYAPPPPPAAARLASMQSVSAGPCFLGASRVKMYDESEKRCDEIQPGDRDVAGYTITHVIKTMVPYADIVRLQDENLRPADHAHLEQSGGFTQWHPVFVQETNTWVAPNTLGAVDRVITDAVYNFILGPNSEGDNSGVLIINGLMTVTMGHSLTAPGANHPYFGLRRPGMRNVLDDLSVLPGFNRGYVVLNEPTIERDPVTGLVCKMTSR